MDFSSNEELSDLVAAALDLGEQMLVCGGEVARVEDTISRLCFAYGANHADVLTITTSIIVTVNFPGKGEITQTRRISGIKFNLSALDALNDLSRRACSNHMPPEELHSELKKIAMLPKYRFAAVCGIWALIAGSFSLFFGGNWLDGIVAACIGIILCLLQSLFAKFEINTYLSIVLCSVLGGLISSLIFAVGMPIHPAMINIGAIMLLIPGVVLTNAIRDIFSGDTISGMLRAVEALVLSVAIAWGFAFIAAPADPESASPAVWVQLITAMTGALGVSMWYNVRGTRLIWCAAGGFAGWGALLLCQYFGMGEMLGYFIASMMIAVYAHVLARVQECPVTVFIATSTIPLIPGGALYYTMRFAMDEAWKDFAAQGLRTFVYAILISAGILMINTIVHAYEVVRK